MYKSSCKKNLLRLATNLSRKFAASVLSDEGTLPRVRFLYFYFLHYSLPLHSSVQHPSRRRRRVRHRHGDGDWRRLRPIVIPDVKDDDDGIKDDDGTTVCCWSSVLAAITSRNASFSLRRNVLFKISNLTRNEFAINNDDCRKSMVSLISSSQLFIYYRCWVVMH